VKPAPMAPARPVDPPRAPKAADIGDAIGSSLREIARRVSGMVLSGAATPSALLEQRRGHGASNSTLTWLGTTRQPGQLVLF
jgi:hypothetical protein